MKSARASVLATMFFSLVAIAPLAGPDQAQAQPVFRTQELACSQGLGAAGRRYIEQVLVARIRCQARAIKGLIHPDTNCRTGNGDEKFQAALRRAELKLSHSLPVHCAGIDLTKLEFPGICSDDNGAPFDTLDLEDCIVAEGHEIISDLLGKYYPADGDFFRGFKSICLRGVPLHAYQMFRGDIRTRSYCSISKALHLIDQDVDCRNDIPAWGPGTGSDDIDARLRRSYVQFLGGIPIECANFDIDELGYQSVCEDGTSGIFTVFDLKECIFDESRPAAQHVIDLLYPVEPVCGNLRVEFGEECDDGTAGNSNTLPNACRTNCQNAGCGDKVIDNDEDCDDGNTNNTDECANNCKFGVCGDGTVQAGEECDDGETLNSDSTPNACRTDCQDPECGDGVTDPNFADEECDDGNKVSNDQCSSTCKIEFCGDSIKQTSEECDGSATVCTDPDAVCSTTCKCQLPCPATGELILHSNFGQECSTNNDCPVGTCDGESGRCETVTSLDSGWTGQAHDADINNLVVTRGFLECDAESAPCGVCELTGLDPVSKACRCRNDNQEICNEPFNENDPDCDACVGGGTKNNDACSSDTDCRETGNTCNAQSKCSHELTRACTTNADCNLVGTCSATTACDCYFGAPFPLSSGGTPACVVNRFFEDVSGTANVDLGEGAITANLRTQVFLGIDTVQPCPMCAGRCAENQSQICIFDDDCGSGTCNHDPVRDDGVRGGVCIEGRNAGSACDVNGINTSFPGKEGREPGGIGYSIDCFPSSDKNISGAGLVIQLTQSTGTSELHSNVVCQENQPELCPCKVCTSDVNVPCNTDEDCASQSGSCAVSANFTCTENSQCASVDVGPCLFPPGIKRCAQATTLACDDNTDCLDRDLGACNLSTCGAIGAAGVFPKPNECQDGLCTDEGNGDGTCTTGPDQTTCDGIIRPNGKGILTCNSNEDCTPSVVGRDAGNCTIVERRDCFLDPIVAHGDPDPSEPVGAATFCIPPTSSEAINKVAGLPGPGRVTNQARSRTFCESDPSRQYQPGIGGCIDD
ncbi:MAG TPA: hypothetical protein VEL28_08305 [Candidatus Binatia bacterium]|nr:hypothetical protein [Candidatus Binatia bacterium]